MRRNWAGENGVWGGVGVGFGNEAEATILPIIMTGEGERSRSVDSRGEG